MAKGSSSNKTTTLLGGLTRKMPPGVDASKGAKGPSVNNDATRSTVGKGHTLGPRTA
jgi:hypothetical protein